MLEVRHSVQIKIWGEISTLGLKLPRHAGLRVHFDDAKRVELDGLSRLDDSSYINERWADADVPRIEVTVDGATHGIRARQKNWRGKWR